MDLDTPGAAYQGQLFYGRVGADELGASAGAGMIIELTPNLQGSLEASLDSIGREDFNA